MYVLDFYKTHESLCFKRQELFLGFVMSSAKTNQKAKKKNHNFCVESVS